MQITLTKVFRSTTKKDGTPLIGKNGRPYTKLALKCNEHGDKWLSGFDGKETQGWREGDTVNVEIEQNGEYLNFSVPKSSHIVNQMGGEDMIKLNQKLDAIWTKLGVIQGLLQMEAPKAPEGTDYIDPEDIPF